MNKKITIGKQTFELTEGTIEGLSYAAGKLDEEACYVEDAANLHAAARIIMAVANYKGG